MARFDPEGGGYDWETAKQVQAVDPSFGPDETGHWPSRVPKIPGVPLDLVGLELKGRSHPTFQQATIANEQLGYNVRRAGDGRYYSQPKLIPTGKFTPWGRQFYKNMATGELSTELAMTFESNGKFYSWPTIWDGRVLTPKEAMERFRKHKGVDPETKGGKPVPGFATEAEAQAHASSKFQGLQNPMQREPFPSERDFFLDQETSGLPPEKVAQGMMTEDDNVTLNPFSLLGPEQQSAVVDNEQVRLFLRKRGGTQPFDLTPEQQMAFQNYGEPQDIRDTIIARTLTGDDSALNVTPEQRAVSQVIHQEMNRTERR